MLSVWKAHYESDIVRVTRKFVINRNVIRVRSPLRIGILTVWPWSSLGPIDRNVVFWEKPITKYQFYSFEKLIMDRSWCCPCAVKSILQYILWKKSPLPADRNAVHVRGNDWIAVWLHLFALRDKTPFIVSKAFNSAFRELCRRAYWPHWHKEEL